MKDLPRKVPRKTRLRRESPGQFRGEHVVPVTRNDFFRSVSYDSSWQWLSFGLSTVLRLNKGWLHSHEGNTAEPPPNCTHAAPQRKYLSGRAIGGELFSLGGILWLQGGVLFFLRGVPFFLGRPLDWFKQKPNNHSKTDEDAFQIYF